jgi:hypothetical protein
MNLGETLTKNHVKFPAKSLEISGIMLERERERERERFAGQPLLTPFYAFLYARVRMRANTQDSYLKGNTGLLQNYLGQAFFALRGTQTPYTIRNSVGVQPPTGLTVGRGIVLNPALRSACTGLPILCAFGAFASSPLSLKTLRKTTNNKQLT